MSSSVRFLRSILAASLAIFGFALWRIDQVVHEKVSIWHSKATVVWAIPFGILLVLLVLSWAAPFQRFVDRETGKTGEKRTFVRILGMAAFALLLPVFSLIVSYPYYDRLLRGTGMSTYIDIFSPVLAYLSVRALLFWLAVLLGIVCVKIFWRRSSWQSAFLVSFLSNLVFFCLVLDFAQVNNDPFAQGWSDMSRVYGASLFFSQRLYGQWFPLPALHPTWHMLLTAPYFFGNLPIWVHRFWGALLQAALTLITGTVLARRMGLKKGLIFWGTALFGFIFLTQIAVLYSLLICVIIIVAWVKPQDFWRTAIFVGLASVWAGLSRINWFPVAGMLAAVIYFLEIPFENRRSWLRYLWKPAAWVLGGTVIAFGANSLYNLWSGNAIQGGQFASSLHSDLLWYRLFPSLEYSLGVLPAALLALAPLVVLTALELRGRRDSLHPLRLAGIIAILLILFAGGLVVSVKIGGGGDLHNLDAFFITLLLVAASVYFGRWTAETHEPQAALTQPVYLPALVFAIGMSAWFLVQNAGPIPIYDRTDSADTVRTIQAESQKVTEHGGEVLFLYQRQLLALKMVEAPLVPDYEQDYLMEMVMSHNQAYIDRFQRDIAAQKFGLIVASNYTIRPVTEGPWMEETNLWFEDVAGPLKCYYEVFFYRGLALYRPKAQPCK